MASDRFAPWVLTLATSGCNVAASSFDNHGSLSGAAESKGDDFVEASSGTDGSSNVNAETGMMVSTAAGESVSSSGSTGDSSHDSLSTGSNDDPTDGGTSGITPPPVTEGQLTVLTYNVAGLPEGLSHSHPAEYTPQISPLLNLYDLALVQEDFAYHEDLGTAANHPYRSEPHPDVNILAAQYGDGINEFSQFTFGELDRVQWDECNGIIDSGSDCLTVKGFFAATHTLAEGIEVDVYDLHMDASSSPEDVAARDAQVAQLVAYINTYSPGHAIIVAGDTNMNADPEDENSLQALLAGAGLVDSCRSLSCDEPYRIDRVFVRSSTNIILEPVSWQVDNRFVDPEGDPLSDHEAVGVTIAWHWSDGN